jgi:hypothetical protein
MAAVESMKGESDQMRVADAVALIRATRDWQRSAFAQEIWSRRREREPIKPECPLSRSE